MMQKVNKALEDMGVRPAPDPVDYSINKKPRREFVKVPGESKAERRMRRKGLFGKPKAFFR